MSSPDGTTPPQSKTVQICALVFLVIGMGCFQALAPSLLPTPRGGGFNFERVLWAAIVGGVSGGLGAGIGKLIESFRK